MPRRKSRKTGKSERGFWEKNIFHLEAPCYDWRDAWMLQQFHVRVATAEVDCLSVTARLKRCRNTPESLEQWFERASVALNRLSEMERERLLCLLKEYLPDADSGHPALLYFRAFFDGNDHALIAHKCFQDLAVWHNYRLFHSTLHFRNLKPKNIFPALLFKTAYRIMQKEQAEVEQQRFKADMESLRLHRFCREYEMIKKTGDIPKSFNVLSKASKKIRRWIADETLPAAERGIAESLQEDLNELRTQIKRRASSGHSESVYVLVNEYKRMFLENILPGQGDVVDLRRDFQRILKSEGLLRYCGKKLWPMLRADIKRRLSPVPKRYDEALAHFGLGKVEEPMLLDPELDDEEVAVGLRISIQQVRVLRDLHASQSGCRRRPRDSRAEEQIAKTIESFRNKGTSEKEIAEALHWPVAKVRSKRTPTVNKLPDYPEVWTKGCHRRTKYRLIRAAIVKSLETDLREDKKFCLTRQDYADILSLTRRQTEGILQNLAEGPGNGTVNS